MQYLLTEEEFLVFRNKAIMKDSQEYLNQRIQYLEKAFRKIVDLEDSEGDDPLDEAIMIAKRAINWAGDE